MGGLTAGSLYALIALGLVLIYKSTTIVNMALGDTLMIGGFLAFTFHVLLGFPYIPSLLLAVACGFGLGVVLERLVFRRLMQATLLSMLLATVGLSFVLKGTGRMIWGGKGDYIPFPPLVDSDPIMIGDMLISPQQFVVLGASIVIMLIFGAFFEMTRVGKWMQATADNMKAARLVGIRIERVYLYTFGVGSALACAAAVLMAPITLLFPDTGFILFFKAFAAAIFGQFWNGHPNKLPVDDWVKAQIGIANCLFHTQHHPLVPDLNAKHSGFWSADCANLWHGHFGTIGLHYDRLQQAYGGAARAEPREFFVQILKRPIHAAA